MRRNIPYVKFGGLKFLEAAHVKDLLSLLRWSQNPRSQMSGFRVAQLVQGLGPASARRLVAALAQAADPAAALRGLQAAARRGRVLAGAARLPARPCGTRRWPAALELAHAVVPAAAAAPARRRGGAPRRPGAAGAAGAAAIASREAFLAELTLDPPEATSDEAGPPHLDEDYLILSTIHSAKGQEWGAVYVLNVVDGCMPADMAAGSAEELEEERRLLYVAMTRAQHQLQLLVPQRFYVTQQSARGDRHLWGGLQPLHPAAGGGLLRAGGCVAARARARRARGRHRRAGLRPGGAGAFGLGLTRARVASESMGFGPLEAHCRTSKRVVEIESRPAAPYLVQRARTVGVLAALRIAKASERTVGCYAMCRDTKKLTGGRFQLSL